MVIELVDSGHVFDGECIVFDKFSDLIYLLDYVVFFYKCLEILFVFCYSFDII